MTDSARTALQPLDIFQILGYTGSDEGQKNQILEEAQNLLLEDLVETDLPSRLSPEDTAKAKQLLTDQSQSLEQRQTQLLGMLHEKVTDLDHLLMDKTAQMKMDVMEERINDLKQQLSSDAFASQQLSQAELWFRRENFAEALRILDAVSTRSPAA